MVHSSDPSEFTTPQTTPLDTNIASEFISSLKVLTCTHIQSIVILHTQVQLCVVHYTHAKLHVLVFIKWIFLHSMFSVLLVVVR